MYIVYAFASTEDTFFWEVCDIMEPILPRQDTSSSHQKTWKLIWVLEEEASDAVSETTKLGSSIYGELRLTTVPDSPIRSGRWHIKKRLSLRWLGYPSCKAQR